MRYYIYRLFVIALGLASAIYLSILLSDGIREMGPDEVAIPATWTVKGFFMIFIVLGVLIAAIAAVSILREIRQERRRPTL